MATILAHLRVKQGLEAQFEATARALFAASYGVEKALLRYEYWRGQEPGLYYCLLSFNDYRGFMSHQTSEHHEAAVPALMETLADMKFEWVDPVTGAAPLPASVPQALAEDASDLAKRYAEMMPLLVAEWWPALRAQADAAAAQDRG